MITFAEYSSLKTSQGIKVFRYNTVFQSDKGGGDVIGLVCMMNPGIAQPESCEIFCKLLTTEYKTKGLVVTKPDPTMKKAMNFIKKAYEINKVKLPERYTIYVENLFNLREKKSKDAKKLAISLKETSNLMFSSRELAETYQFVWLAWGNTNINNQKQNSLLKKFPDAIKVHKSNYKGELRETDYPVHPLYMNEDYFLEVALNRVKK